MSKAERGATRDTPDVEEMVTDHSITKRRNAGPGWHDGRLEEFHAPTARPSAFVFHHGPESAEGLKAYRRPDGSAALFRRECDATRFDESARRPAMPEHGAGLITEVFACGTARTSRRSARARGA
ncbi:hypothetical protein ABZS77_18975 [Micromonospora sp. NPDC005298]|uniref:hypothetical protein n=1 Tax=Micromonospora sp. NPDC005298 TaxID=3156873 RepID=UPI0033ACE618